MTNTIKDRILSAAIGGGFSLIVALIVSFTAFKRDNVITIDRTIEEELEKKLDKETFNDYRNVHEKQHSKEEETNKEFRGWLREEVLGIREDIKELKKE